MNVELKFLTEEDGSVSPVGLILFTAIVVFGSIVGLTTMRSHVVQQFGDLAVALDSLQQTFSYNIGRDNNGDGDFADAGEFEIMGEFDDSIDLTDNFNEAPACLDMTVAP